MRLNEYQQLAQRTANPKLTQFKKVENGLMGCCGEAGDQLWYLAQLATGLNVTLEFIAEMNIDKLRKRYPVKFEAGQSINRDNDK